VQQIPLGDAEHPGEHHPEHPRDDDVGVHDGVGERPGVFGDQDAFADAAATSDEFGHDVHDQGDRRRHPQPRGDERRGARQDHHGELAYPAHPQHGRRVPDHRVERPHAIADLDDQRPEHRERDERELHSQRRAPQHQGDRQDRDDRDGLEKLDDPGRAAVSEPIQPDQRADEDRRAGADRQPDRPPFQRLAHRRPQRR
jgi:hypothetical protein